MILRQYLPSPALADTVSGITMLQVDHLPAEWDIPLVAKAAPSVVYQSSGKEDRLVLYGQNVAAMGFRASGHVLMIAFFLHPHRLRSLFGFRASEVTDRCMDLSFLPAVQRLGLIGQLESAGTVEERLRRMEELLVTLRENGRDEASRMAAHAVRVMAGSRGLVSLRKLQEDLRVMERSMQRMFVDEVGVSPKVYSRICQFQPAFQQLSAGQFIRLSDIAYNNGYADQSHLIRTFREFTGFTPTEYLGRTAAFLAAVEAGARGMG